MKIKDALSHVFERNKIVLNLIIIILINLVSVTLYFRFDLTRNNSYSLSDISKEVVTGLEDPLNIKIFFSEDLPAPYNSVYRYLKDLMEEYAEYGNEYFTYEFVDLNKDKSLASDFGIYPIQVREIASDELKFKNAYMGLAIVHGDLIEKLTSITETEGLEYRISTTIKKMTGKIDTLLKLEEPIKVTLYASSDLPISGIQGLDKKVGEIVNKTNVENYNKIEYQFIEAEGNKSIIDTAESYGVPRLTWPSLRTRDGRRIKAGEGVLGIVVKLGERFENINLISRSIFGEYMVGDLEDLQDSINKAVDNVINVNPAIGYVTGHGEVDLSNPEDGGANMKAMLSDMYDLREIDLSKEDIPEDINILMVNGPKKEYSDYELFKIDQFIMRGKSVFFVIDSFFEISQQQAMRMGARGPMALPLNTGIEKLTAHYGISVNKDIVLDEKCYKANQQGFAGQDIYFIPFIQREGLNDESVITRDLKTIVWPKASSLTVKEDTFKEMGIESTVLVKSSEKSWLMEGRINFMPFAITPPVDESKMSSRDLAVLAEGLFASYFKDREIPEKEEKKKVKDSSIKSTLVQYKALKPAKIIVAATSQITLSNIIDNDGKSINAIFLHNAIDYLAGNTDVQEMRSKGLAFNPIDDSGDKTRFIIKLFNIMGLPIIVILIGIFIWRQRLKRKKKIMEEFAK